MEISVVELPLGGLDDGEEVADAQRAAEGEHEVRQEILSEKHAISMPGSGSLRAVPSPLLRARMVRMGFHHVALATKDTAATHRFYTEVMGFELVKVVAGPTPGTERDGFTKHFFYATNTGPYGDGTEYKDLIAFWEINDPDIGTDFGVDLNASAGLPAWINHVAFDAPTREALDAHRRRWTEHGQTVLEVDHGFCVSIYITDPSGNMVEFCHTTHEFTAQDKALAHERLLTARPDFDDGATITVHRAVTAAGT